MITVQEAQDAHAKAVAVAKVAAQEYVDNYYGGQDAGACGFAWATFSPRNKGNTRLGKQERKVMEAIGFRKDWTGKSWQLWNPSQYPGQNVDTKFKGAQAYAQMFETLTGVRLSYGDRLD